jgi:hypothetical protein
MKARKRKEDQVKQ